MHAWLASWCDLKSAFILLSLLSQTTFFREFKPSAARIAQARSSADAQIVPAKVEESRPIHTRSATTGVATVGRAGFALRNKALQPDTVAAVRGVSSQLNAVADASAASSPEGAPSPSAVAKEGSGLGLPSAMALRKQLLDMRSLEASRVEVSCNLHHETPT